MPASKYWPLQKRLSEIGKMSELDPDMLDGLRVSLCNTIANAKTLRVSGRACEVRGPLLKARVTGRIGEICSLFEPGTGRVGTAQIVGFTGQETFLAPFGNVQGLSPRTEVCPSGRNLEIAASTDLLGCLLDPYGKVLSRITATSLTGVPSRLVPIEAGAPKPSERRSVDSAFETGLRAIDGLLTVGEGQRMGIFGPPGSGKSQLVLNLLASCNTDVIVIGLVGERGREIPDFVSSLQESGRMDKCAVVATTSDSPAQDRLVGAMTATAIAEFFRDAGLNVLLIIDSVTRVARAAREIGLAMGEPSVRRGFTPSVFQMLPRLLERSGTAKNGSITAFYTILAEGEEQSDPIFEECKSLLDGHIVLSPKLASEGHFPAIDILASVSRTMNAVVSADHTEQARQFRKYWSALNEVEILRRIGEYKEGGDPVADKAIALQDELRSYLVQSSADPSSFSEAVDGLDIVL